MAAKKANNTTNKATPDFYETLLDFSATFAEELKAKRARLDGLIGEAHWLSVGGYKESLLRGLLRDWVPTNLEVGTGFVLARQQGKRLMSKQIDVLIWDSGRHSPVFRDGEFVIIPPEACRAAIEVKGNLDSAQLSEALANLERVTTLARFCAQTGPTPPPFRALFAFQMDEKSTGKNAQPAHGGLTWPVSIFNSLWKLYDRGGDQEFLWSRDERIAKSRQVSGKWELPWIDMVCVLGKGVIRQEEWALNGDPVPTYGAYGGVPGRDVSYSAFELALRVRLLSPGGLYAYEWPGAISLMARDEKRASPAFMPMERPPKISTIGQLSASDAQILSKSYHRPHGARWPKPK